MDAGLSDADTVADDPLDEMDVGLSDAETIPGNPTGESWSSLAKADWRTLVFAGKMIQRMTLSDYSVQNGGSMNMNR